MHLFILVMTKEQEDGPMLHVQTHIATSVRENNKRMSYVIVIYSALALLHLRNKVIPVDICSRAAGTYRDAGTSPFNLCMTNTLLSPISINGGKIFTI